MEPLTEFEDLWISDEAAAEWLWNHADNADLSERAKVRCRAIAERFRELSRRIAAENAPELNGGEQGEEIST